MSESPCGGDRCPNKFTTCTATHPYQCPRITRTNCTAHLSHTSKGGIPTTPCSLWHSEAEYGLTPHARIKKHGEEQSRRAPK
jgi:hypothetical protein